MEECTARALHGAEHANVLNTTVRYRVGTSNGMRSMPLPKRIVSPTG